MIPPLRYISTMTSTTTPTTTMQHHSVLFEPYYLRFVLFFFLSSSKTMMRYKSTPTMMFSLTNRDRKLFRLCLRLGTATSRWRPEDKLPRHKLLRFLSPTILEAKGNAATKATITFPSRNQRSLIYPLRSRDKGKLIKSTRLNKWIPKKLLILHNKPNWMHQNALVIRDSQTLLLFRFKPLR